MVFVFVILTQVYSLKSVTLADVNQSVTFSFSTKTARPKTASYFELRLERETRRGSVSNSS